MNTTEVNMNGTAKVLLLVAALCASLNLFAFLAAPRSCEWGSDTYFWAGIIVVLLSAAMPFFFRAGHKIVYRLILGIGMACTVVAAWVMGFSLSGMILMCRLF